MQYISDQNINLQNFVDVVLNFNKVELSPQIVEKIILKRNMLEKKIENQEIMYGINTGFGSLKDFIINNNELEKLQENIILSHSVGTGDPVNASIVRGMIYLRLISFCKCNSGVTIELCRFLVTALNNGYIPMVPCQGTVGASGDLAPLSHMALGFIGKGKAYDYQDNTWKDADIIMKKLNMKPIVLKSKEGLALTNGTQFMTSFVAHSMCFSINIMKISNIITATTIEALHGNLDAFDARIHEVKKYPGQICVASDIKKILSTPNVSEIQKKYGRKNIQDAYSIRCVPQIHGTAFGIIDNCLSKLEIEMNSCNDNPLIFDDNEILSGGNFHGMEIAYTADQIAYAMALLCNTSERRIEQMVNSNLNNFLPSYLIKNPKTIGLNSGLMMCQYTAAAITAENRSLANPASLNSIPTCMGLEDVVSMGGYCSRKSYDSVLNTYRVYSIELFCALQALTFTPEKPNQITDKIINHLRNNLNIPVITHDIYYADYINIIFLDLFNNPLIYLNNM